MRKLLYVVMLLVAVVACQEKKQQEKNVHQSEVDSIIYTAVMSQSLDKAIAVIGKKLIGIR